MGQTLNITEEFCRHRCYHEETVADLEAKYSPEYQDNSSRNPIQTVGQNENEEFKEDYKLWYALQRENEDLKDEAQYAQEYDISEQSKEDEEAKYDNSQPEENENQDEDDEIENQDHFDAYEDIYKAIIKRSETGKCITN